MTIEFISGIDDAPLLRALAEDVPSMAPEIRNQLRLIAQRLEDGETVGKLRCRRCGEMAEVSIHRANIHG